MPILDCSVSSCIHYADSRCCKGNILVDGSSAMEADGTCCSSFYERDEDNFRNEYESPDYSLQVDCEAMKCRFNDNGECSAEHIGISGNGACRCEETACSSFEFGSAYGGDD